MCCAMQGDRFGGALDAAAKQFSGAMDAGLIPMEFVNDMRKKGTLIMGIGHRVKSVSDLKMFVLFPDIVAMCGVVMILMAVELYPLIFIDLRVRYEDSYMYQLMYEEKCM